MGLDNYSRYWYITTVRILFLFLFSTLLLSCSDRKRLNLDDSVEVLRDNFGINHIYAKNQEKPFVSPF